MAWQDDWKTIFKTGTDWLRVKKDNSEPTLEHAEEAGEYEDDEGETRPKFLVYRLDLERLKLVKSPEDPLRVYLVPAAYDSSWPHALSQYEEWFARDLQKVADSCGVDALELAKSFTSTDPRERAEAYQAVAGYHGYENFDSDPLDLTEEKLDSRWK